MGRGARYEQCSCFPVSVWPGGGRLDLLPLDTAVVEVVALPFKVMLGAELEAIVGDSVGIL